MEVFDQLQIINLEKPAKAPDFVKLSVGVYYDSIMIAFARLYDSDKSARTIFDLLNKGKTNISLFKQSEQVASKIEFYLDSLIKGELSETIAIIRTRRDKLFAHNDKCYFGKYKKITQELPMYRLWELRDFTENIIEFFMDLYECSVTVTMQSIDLKDLFDI